MQLFNKSVLGKLAVHCIASAVKVAKSFADDIKFTKAKEAFSLKSFLVHCNFYICMFVIIFCTSIMGIGFLLTTYNIHAAGNFMYVAM